MTENTRGKLFNFLFKFREQNNRFPSMSEIRDFHQGDYQAVVTMLKNLDEEGSVVYPLYKRKDRPVNIMLTTKGVKKYVS